MKAVLSESYRKLFTNDKKYYRKKFVLVVIKSGISDFIRGKFETKAQILAMRFALRSCWRPLQATKFFSLIFTYSALKIVCLIDSVVR